ncbi:MAG TPA: hypothetical protein VMW17_00145 [Candidatus Binatia bacterium]|nr:hypothetical protein [Candidatus Binatia bacterium]
MTVQSLRERSAEWWCRVVLRFLAVAFAVVGTQFFLAPDATVRSINWMGSWFGGFPQAPVSELRFYVSLATGYMALVTVLAYYAQRDLRRYRDFVALLVLGKATTSLSSFAFYHYSLPAFVYLLNFLVDGSIALTAAVIWFVIPSLPNDQPRAEARGARTPEPIVQAIAEAMVPSGGPFAAGAREHAMTSEIDAFVAGVGGGAVGGFRRILWLFEFSPFFLPPLRWRRFSRLSLDERISTLEQWEQSSWMPRRQLVHMLKILMMTQFYSRPEIEAQLGYPHPLDRVPRAQATA